VISSNHHDLSLTMEDENTADAGSHGRARRYAGLVRARMSFASRGTWDGTIKAEGRDRTDPTSSGKCPTNVPDAGK